MSNHVHMVATTPIAHDLSAFVQRLAQRYARYRNQRRGGSGKLFEERFWCVPLEAEAHVAVTLAYVELNPVRAGMTPSPAAYPWSTYRLCAGDERRSRVPAHIWTPSEWYLGLADTQAERAVRFAEWVTHCRAKDLTPESVEAIRELEQPSSERYTRRLRRPDGTHALEARAIYRSGQPRARETIPTSVARVSRLPHP